jgi:hypothetical protein
MLKRTDKPTARDQSQQDNTGHPNDRLALSEPIDDFSDGLPHGSSLSEPQPGNRLDFDAVC